MLYVKYLMYLVILTVSLPLFYTKAQPLKLEVMHMPRIPALREGGDRKKFRVILGYIATARPVRTH